MSKNQSRCNEKEMFANFLHEVLLEDSPFSQILFITSMLCIFVLGLIGNLLTCIVICCDRTMHTATNYYLLNLAVSDLFVTMAILLEVHEHLSESYQFGQAFCKIHFFLVLLLWNASISTITALAIERFIAIWYPLSLNSTPVWRRVAKVIALIWLVALLESVPEVWTAELIKTKKSSICFTMPTPYGRIMNGLLALTSFLAPLVIMIFVYGMIAFKVTRVEKGTGSEAVFNHRDNSRKVNKLVGLTASFIVCWLPITALRVVIYVGDVTSLLRQPMIWRIGYKLTIFNSWFGVMLNPVLFSLMSTKFRNSLKSLWRKKFKKSLPRISKVQHSTTI